MIVLISLEGVLAEQGEDLRKLGPTPFGKAIFSSLHTNNLSIAILSTCEREQTARDWLTQEGFRGYSLLFTAEKSIHSGLEFKVDTVSQMIAMGHHIMYMIDGDPEILTPMVSTLGVPVLLAVPTWAKPGKGVDLPYQPWDSVVATVHEQSLQKARLLEKQESDA